MLLSSILALALQADPSRWDWRPFAVGGFGFGDSAMTFDAARIERRGTVVRAWERHSFNYSGRMPSDHETRYEIDCAARTARITATVEYPNMPGSFRAIRRRVTEAARPIAPDSTEAGLAARLCREGVPVAVGAWVWLDSPGAEGPEARFAYEDSPWRDGPQVRLWVSYETVDPERARRIDIEPRLARVDVVARIELNCAARTARTLELLTSGPFREPTRAETPAAAPLPVVAQTREAVLMTRLCPATTE